MVLNNNGNGPTPNVAMSLQPNLADSGDYVNLIDDDPPPPLSYADAGGRFVLEWPIVQQQRRTASVERMEPKGSIFYEPQLPYAMGESLFFSSFGLHSSLSKHPSLSSQIVNPGYCSAFSCQRA